MSFRLGLLNPNTDYRHTDAMAGVATAALPAGCEVVAVTAARGPASIESEADAAVAAGEVVAMMVANPGLDAYLIACFGDPGLDAARELSPAPVVGIGEAAFTAACMVAGRFAVITTLRRGIPALEDMIAARGIDRRCAGVLALDIPVAEQGSAFPDTTAAIVAAARGAVSERSAEALILACGGMADVAQAVRETVGVPVCDGVGFGAMLAYGLWRTGIATSKIGTYAPPEPIPYTGMPSPAGA
ncbi:MAG TPA: aspartate/glutamate racemase family protein [Gaiellales bacterium]